MSARRLFVRMLAAPYFAATFTGLITVFLAGSTALTIYQNRALAWSIMLNSLSWFCLGGAWFFMFAGREFRRMRREFNAMMDSGPPREGWRRILFYDDAGRFVAAIYPSNDGTNSIHIASHHFAGAPIAAADGVLPIPSYVVRFAPK